MSWTVPMDVLPYFVMAIFLSCGMAVGEASVTQDTFGFFVDPEIGSNQTVRRLTMRDDRNVSVQLIDFGATVTSIRIPDKNGTFDDIVLGFDDVQSYYDSLNPYFGATVGRVANRIRGGAFTLDGTTYQLVKNIGNDTLHGGLRGLSRVMWNAEVRGSNQVIMTYTSANFSEGFPGEVIAEATFTLITNDQNSSQLVITYKATTTQRTPINIVNHSYFNLAGHGSGKDGLYRQKVRINADKITELDESLLPTGEIIDVEGTEFDLRSMQELGTAINRTSNDGFDINYCIINGTTGLHLRDTAYVLDEESGRYLEVSTDQPGVQFYTHNNDNEFTGKEGIIYRRHGALCLETQNYPDAVNHENFPNSIFEPGKLYSHTTSYLFGVIN